VNYADLFEVHDYGFVFEGKKGFGITAGADLSLSPESGCSSLPEAMEVFEMDPKPATLASPVCGQKALDGPATIADDNYFLSQVAAAHPAPELAGYPLKETA
jgi:hypothetical protein